MKVHVGYSHWQEIPEWARFLVVYDIPRNELEESYLGLDYLRGKPISEVIRLDRRNDPSFKRTFFDVAGDSKVEVRKLEEIIE